MEQKVKFLLSSETNKTLLFSGINNNEAVAFSARQFAIASAKIQKTLLIDACIMQPDAHNEFGLELTPGLTDLLIGQADITKVIKVTEINNLSLLPGGTQTPNFRLLSDAGAMDKLLAKLVPKYDRIIIEFPDLTPRICNDGVLRIADAVFIVVDSDIPARNLTNMLKDCGADMLRSAFFILNKR